MVPGELGISTIHDVGPGAILVEHIEQPHALTADDAHLERQKIEQRASVSAGGVRLVFLIQSLLNHTVAMLTQLLA
jgi:hypothetical protein